MLKLKRGGTTQSRRQGKYERKECKEEPEKKDKRIGNKILTLETTMLTTLPVMI